VEHAHHDEGASITPMMTKLKSFVLTAWRWLQSPYPLRKDKDR
jgi:hypothetical protein